MSETNATAHAAQAAVSSLRQAARMHKRLSQQHRREAVRIMSQIDDIRQLCREVGITVIDEPEATSHGHHASTRS